MIHKNLHLLQFMVQ